MTSNAARSERAPDAPADFSLAWDRHDPEGDHERGGAAAMLDRLLDAERQT